VTLRRFAFTALHNVVEHSRAAAARVELVMDDGELRLTVDDDGVGFDPKTTCANASLGLIDRTQLAADYSAPLTDAAVQAMARYFKEYKYGASPTDAEVVKSRGIGDQSFYVIKLVSPRADALDFNAAGKITGISLMSMAGDRQEERLRGVPSTR
jgi:hypothetical protein